MPGVPDSHPPEDTSSPATDGLRPAESKAVGSTAGQGQVVDVVRSEERMRAGTEVRVSSRAVLRKYVVTETVTQTIQVRHEEVRVDHEPMAHGQDLGPSSLDDPLVQGPYFDDRVVEVVLHREVPVVQMMVVATERVTLHVDTVTEQVPVTAHLQQERVEVEQSPRTTVR